MFIDYENDCDSVPVILIGADEIAGRVVRGCGERVIAFESVDDFDRWRASRDTARRTIKSDVVAALGELGFTLDDLPPRLRSIVDVFSSRRVVPGMAELQKLGPSRRSLYRMWEGELRETPSRFLRRVRLLHAERLIAGGASSKEAALRAGFGSVDRMRRLIAERGGQSSRRTANQR